MANTDNSPARLLLSRGLRLAPLHRLDESTPLLVCLVVPERGPGAGEPFLLRDDPEAATYAGVLCDRDAHIHQLLEISVQKLHLGDVQHSAQKYQITNGYLDGQWFAHGEYLRTLSPRRVLATPGERVNPAPLLIESPTSSDTPFLTTRFLPWELCRDDALLLGHGLPAYSSSRHRYLRPAAEAAPQTFVATDPESPVTSQTVSLDKVLAEAGGRRLFNPQAGLIRVTASIPLDLETAARIVEGQPWAESSGQLAVLELAEPFATLHQWSHGSKAHPFRLHARDQAVSRAHESLYLKLTLLLSAFQAVRNQVQIHQLPLLNLTPQSFRVNLTGSGGGFPSLWTARTCLVRGGQAYPLEIKSTEQRYFLRLGTIKPSPFTPEGVGAHSYGVGRIQIKSVTAEAGGTVMDGTLIADDYLGLDPHDMLWFKLPGGDAPVEFLAHVFKAEQRGSREAKFRTVPASFPPAVVEKLKASAGVYFPKSPYEVWPLLSSPCDLYSLGVIAVRLLLADGETDLPATLDAFFSLARQLDGAGVPAAELAGQLRRLAAADPQIRDLLRFPLGGEAFAANLPESLAAGQDIVLRLVVWLVRLFPGTGQNSFCQSFGDVSPQALETVFDQPMQELAQILNVLRSLLVANVFENEELALAITRLLQA